MADKGSKKDFYDKLSSLGGIFIAIAGFMATFLYNKNQLKLQEQKTNIDIKISQVGLLERCMRYVTSDNPKEREFGYFVFATNGFEELAMQLIDSKADQAGVGVVKTIASENDNKNSDLARKILSRLASDSGVKARQPTDIFEGKDLVIKDKSGKKIANTYYEKGKDTILFNIAKLKAKELGLKSDLGLAAMNDIIVQNGYNSPVTKNAISFANKELGGNPKTGIDERAWLEKFIRYRYDWCMKSPHKYMQRMADTRIKFFLDQAIANNLSLSGEKAK